MARSLTIDVKDIRSVTDFQRNAKTHITRLKKTKAPMVLTVNGSASVVVQDASTYQHLLDHVEALEERQNFIAAINEGLKDFEEGRFYSLEELKRR
jgi:PHD/YefM family antitoxin component YafN of YafNO toxin-antitoxin module